MPRQIKHRDEARQAILRGMDAVAELVGSTLGPRGHTVILGRQIGPPLVTKDGVTVAEGISVPDPWENEGVKLIQEVAKRTNSEAGDGTTAATILTRALYREGLRHVTAGADSQALERGMRRGAALVVAELRRIAIPVDPSDLATLTSVATVSANGDTEMGSVVGRAVHHAGIEGNYTLDPSPTAETTFQVAEGLQFQRGLDKWPQFVNDPRGMAVFGTSNIFLTDRHLIDGNEMAKLLEIYRKGAGDVPLLIVAEDIAQGALQVLTVNNPRTVRVCPVRVPGSGPEKKEILEDLAILTGAVAYTIARGNVVSEARIEDFGSADRVLVTAHRTTIVGGAGQKERVELRKEELRQRIADPEIEEFVRAGLEKRLAAISAKIAVIKLGAGVNSKLLEKRYRAEDSLNATLGALKEGIVPGGGVALLRCRQALEEALEEFPGDERLGGKIVSSALAQPLRTIAANAGASPDVVSAQVAGFQGLDTGGQPGSEQPDGGVYAAGCGPDYLRHGYNAASGQYEDLVSAGIVDPVKVVRLALENSVELAGLLLTSSGAAVDVPDPVQQAAMIAARQSVPGGRP